MKSGPTECSAYARGLTLRRSAAAVLVACLVLLFCDSALGRWHPAPTTQPWQWQLQGKIDSGVDASVYDVDGFETPASVVRALHEQGRHRADPPGDVGHQVR